MPACSRASALYADAGLEPSEIDGLVSFTMDTNADHDLQTALGLPLVRWTGKAPFGGEGAYATFQLAAAAIELAVSELGAGDVVLVKGSRSVGLELVADELRIKLGEGEGGA